MAKKAKEDDPKAAKDLDFFKTKIMIGTLAEIICLSVSVTLFLKTQYLKGRISIIDKYTGTMIAIFALALIADFIFFRYRGKRPE